MRVTYSATILATALTAAANPVGKPYNPFPNEVRFIEPFLVARDVADPGPPTPKKLTLAFWVLALCLALFALLFALCTWPTLDRHLRRKREERELQEKEATDARLNAAKTIDWATGRPPSLSPEESEWVENEERRRHRESRRLERENKVKEMEEGRARSTDSLQKKLDNQARRDDDAIDNLFVPFENSTGETGLRVMEEGRATPVLPKPAVLRLPSQSPAPATTLATSIPETSDVTDFALAKKDTPPSPHRYPTSTVISETPMRRDPRSQF